MPRKKKAVAADAPATDAPAAPAVSRLRAIRANASATPGEFAWKGRTFRVGARSPDSDALFGQMVVAAEGTNIDAAVVARELTREDAAAQRAALAKWRTADAHAAGGDLWCDYVTGPCARVGLELYLQTLLEEFDPVLKAWTRHAHRGEVRRLLAGRCEAARAAVQAAAPAFYALAREHAAEGGRPESAPAAIDAAETAVLAEAAGYGA